MDKEEEEACIHILEGVGMTTTIMVTKISGRIRTTTMEEILVNGDSGRYKFELI